MFSLGLVTAGSPFRNGHLLPCNEKGEHCAAGLRTGLAGTVHNNVPVSLYSENFLIPLERDNFAVNFPCSRKLFTNHPGTCTWHISDELVNRFDPSSYFYNNNNNCNCKFMSIFSHEL